MQRPQVQSLVQVLRSHMPQNSEAPVLQVLKPTCSGGQQHSQRVHAATEDAACVTRICHTPQLRLHAAKEINEFLKRSKVLCIRWPKYWSFSFSISPSNEYSGLISFRIEWLDLLEVQGTLKSLLQHHSSKASILQHSAFFMVQLTSIHDY